jgi:hypothetical protein
MPRDGSMTLSDVRGPTLANVCETCGRRGHYGVERLLAEHGDAKLTDLLVTLADSPRHAQLASTTDAGPRTSASSVFVTICQCWISPPVQARRCTTVMQTPGLPVPAQASTAALSYL